MKGPTNYAAKSEKYKALLAESKERFDAKLDKKKEELDFWRANNLLWTYRGCMTRDVLPEGCKDIAYGNRVERTMGRYSCKVHLMTECLKDESQ